MPLKVLMFGWELPPFNSGGLGVACHGLCQSLAEMGVEVTFVLPKRVDARADFMHLIFADVPDCPLLASPYTTTPTSPNASQTDICQTVLAYARQAAAISRREKFDLVHAHDWLCFPAGQAAADISGKPLVSHIHATEFDRSGGLFVNPAVYTIEKQGLSRAAKVIALSQFLKDLLVRHYQIDSQKIAVVHNGIDPHEFSPSSSGERSLSMIKKAGFKIILYVGRLTLQKGVDHFIRSASRVIKYLPKTVFVIVGSGDMEHQLVEQTAQLGISDHVLFGGFLRGNLLKQVYQSADLFVMPSVSEPFGLTALESIALGTPAIISKQSGVSETITHALKVDFWDINEMSNQIIAVLKHGVLRRTLKNNGLQEIKQVTWSQAASKIISVYREVIGK